MRKPVAFKDIVQNSDDQDMVERLNGALRQADYEKPDQDPEGEPDPGF